MGQSRADKPILIDQNLKFQISRLGGAMLAVVRRWTARRHHLCGAANVNTTKSEAIGRLVTSQRGPGGRERDLTVRRSGQRVPFHTSKVLLYP